MYWLKVVLISSLLISTLLGSQTEALEEASNYFKQKEYIKANEIWKKLAESGSVEAQVFIGDAYLQGLGEEYNYNEAAKWYEKAATQNNPTAQYQLGKMYLSGKGFEKDIEKAFRFFYLSAEQGYLYAQMELATIYFDGKLVPINHNESFKWAKKAAEQGYSAAFMQLGLMYYNGYGCEKSLTNALVYFKKDCDNKDFYSCNAVRTISYQMMQEANYYFNKKDYSKSFEIFSQMYELGINQAAYYIGYHYDEGLGVNKNVKEAIKWYKKSSDDTMQIAGYKIATMYYQGIGVDKNISEAISWYEKAGRKFNINAQLQLGKLYFEGKEVKQDFSKAKGWLLGASMIEQPEALQYLSSMYYSGLGVKKNRSLAYALSSIACEYQFGKNNLKLSECKEKIKFELSSEEIARSVVIIDEIEKVARKMEVPQIILKHEIN